MQKYLRSFIPFGLFAALFLSACASRSSETAFLGLQDNEAKARSEFVSSVDYDLNFDLYGDQDLFRGNVLVYFELAEGSASKKEDLFLDFDKGTIQSLEINGAKIVAQYDTHRITLPYKSLKIGKNTIAVKFEKAHSHDGSGFHRFTDPVDNAVYLYTDLEPFDANRVFPCFDQPNLKARYRVRANAPKSWELVSYALPETTELRGENKVWVFPWSARFSTYVFSLHAGPYKIWNAKAGKIPLRLMARQSLASKVDYKGWLKVTQQGFAFFQKYFGYDYPFGKYDQIIVPEFNAGAMENVGAVTFSEWYVHRSKPTDEQLERRANVILHEMAHMWFGNLVTMRWWDGLWLNESFATYLASVALERATSFNKAWHSFYSGTKQWAYWTDELVTTHPIQGPVANTTEAFANFDGITYGKGASTLKQLHFLIGDKAFSDGLKIYFKRYAFKNTELNDFISSLEESSGRSLQSWVQDWLMTAGLNSLRTQWSCENAKLKEIELLQSAPSDNPTIREHKTKLAFLNRNGNSISVTSSLETSYKGEKSLVKLDKALSCPVAVYPNYQDHDYVKVILDKPSLETAKKDLSTLKDPLLRNMMAQSLWNMVRDAEWSLLPYLDVLYLHLPKERDPRTGSAMQKTISSLGSYLRYAKEYAPSEKIEMAQRHLEKFLAKQLRLARAGSDEQVSYFSSYIKIGESQEAQAEWVAWLDSKNLPKGLSLGQDRRWNLIERLNSLGHPQAEELIEAEMKREKNDFADKAALGARTIRPNAQVKRAMLDRVLKGKDSLDDKKQIMWNLFPSGQVALMKTWEDEYYKILPKVVVDEDSGFVRTFIGSLTPALCTVESVERLGRFIDSKKNKFSHAVLKALKIAHQEDGRCVAILNKMKEGA